MTRAIPLALTTLLLAGCPKAPQHVVLHDAPAGARADDLGGMAEVFVVRPGIMAFAVSFGIQINEMSVGEIRSNDYVHEIVEPGIVDVVARAETTCRATFPVEADTRYYVRAKPKMGWWYARVQLELLDPDSGETAVLQCLDQTWK